MKLKERINELVEKYSDEFKQRVDKKQKLKLKMEEEYFKAKEIQVVRVAKEKARIEADKEINNLNSNKSGDGGEFLSKVSTFFTSNGSEVKTDRVRKML